MAKEKAKILMLFEGAKTDVKLMTHLLEVYGIDNNHTIVSYNTNIYTLYNEDVCGRRSRKQGSFAGAERA